MSNEKAIWDFFHGKGLNDYGVAGLMGNLYAESGLMPNNLQNTGNKKLGMTDAEYVEAVDNGTYKKFVKDSQGFGLAQWTFWSRKQALLDYANTLGASIGDLNMQLDFLWKELTESYSGVLSVLRNASSILEASNAVLFDFERPANQDESVQRKRANFGQVYYDKYVSTPQTEGVVNLTAVERVIATAKSQVGYLEKASNSQLDSNTANAGRNNWTKYARDLDRLGVYNFPKNGYAWCDMFVDWCFVTTFGVELAWKMTNQPMGGCGAGCTYSAQYYRNMGRFHKSNPQPGDQIFFSEDGGATSYHTGLVVAVDSKRVYTIEGNTSSDPGVVENGGSVNEKSYSLSYAKIGGYGTPDYSLVEEEDDMDVKRFEELWLEYRKGLQDNDASQYSEQARQWAVDNGLIAGNNAAEFNGMWQDMLTREQFVTVLFRFAQLMGKA